MAYKTSAQRTNARQDKIWEIYEGQNKSKKATDEVFKLEKKYLLLTGNVNDIFAKNKLNKRSDVLLAINNLRNDGILISSKDEKFLLKQARFRDKPYLRFGAKPKIQTLKGTAYYVRTDVEDDQEHWAGNNLSTNDGFYIIHTGKLHHIYQL